MITRNEIIGLAGAYDMEVQSEDPQQYKIRFQGNGTFIDTWNGKKGFTIGVYDKKTSTMHFHRFQNLLKFENILIALQKAFEE